MSCGSVICLCFKPHGPGLFCLYFYEHYGLLYSYLKGSLISPYSTPGLLWLAALNASTCFLVPKVYELYGQVYWSHTLPSVPTFAINHFSCWKCPTEVSWRRKDLLFAYSLGECGPHSGKGMDGCWSRWVCGYRSLQHGLLHLRKPRGRVFAQTRAGYKPQSPPIWSTFTSQVSLLKVLQLPYTAAGDRE